MNTLTKTASALLVASFLFPVTVAGAADASKPGGFNPPSAPSPSVSEPEGHNTFKRVSKQTTDPNDPCYGVEFCSQPETVIPRKPVFKTVASKSSRSCDPLFNRITKSNMLKTVPAYNECLRKNGTN